jgi:hypothetical protein
MPNLETTAGAETYPEALPHGRSVALPLLLAGTLVTVHTRNTRYRMVVVDGSARQVEVYGGTLLPHRTHAEIIGAIDGNDETKVGWIEEGSRLELMTEHGRILTSIVESVAVDVDPAVTDEETAEWSSTVTEALSQ